MHYKIMDPVDPDSQFYFAENCLNRFLKLQYTNFYELFRVLFVNGQNSQQKEIRHNVKTSRLTKNHQQ